MESLFASGHCWLVGPIVVAQCGIHGSICDPMLEPMGIMPDHLEPSKILEFGCASHCIIPYELKVSYHYDIRDVQGLLERGALTRGASAVLTRQQDFYWRCKVLETSARFMAMFIEEINHYLLFHAYQDLEPRQYLHSTCAYCISPKGRRASNCALQVTTST